MKIQWTEPAVEDPEAIRDFIARDSDHYAAQFVERVLEAVDSLSESPKRGRKVPEAGRQDIRELLFGNYRIMYRVESERVLLLAVIHGARNLNRQARRRWDF